MDRTTHAKGFEKAALFIIRFVGMAVVLLICTRISAQASFDVPFNSVRSASMGESSLASMGEAAAIFSNPAGIAGMRSGQASFMYNSLYTGLPGVSAMGLGYMAVAIPTRYGSVGLGLGDFKASGLKEERTIALSYGQTVIPGFMQFGLTAKQLYQKYITDGDALAARDPVFANGTSKSAMGLDLGLVASVTGPVKAGLSVRNINRPDVGLATADRLPMEIEGGLIFDVSGIGLRATGDMSYKDAGFGSTGDKAMPIFGLEKELIGRSFVMRLGANPMEFTGGAGVRLGRLGFDYGFALSRSIMADNMGTHRVGMNMEFGQGTYRTRAQQGDHEQTHRGLSKSDEFDYLNLDNKALFGN